MIKWKEAVIDGSYLMGYDIDVKVTGQLEIVGFDAADVRRFFTDEQLQQKSQAGLELRCCRLWSLFAAHLSFSKQLSNNKTVR